MVVTCTDLFFTKASTVLACGVPRLLCDISYVTLVPRPLRGGFLYYMYCMISEHTCMTRREREKKLEVKSMLLRYISVLFLALNHNTRGAFGALTGGFVTLKFTTTAIALGLMMLHRLSRTS